MDKVTKKIWWSNNSGNSSYLALKTWKELCKPKNLGCLSFRTLFDMNNALLSKLDWSMGRREEALWACTLREKYLKGKSFF